MVMAVIYLKSVSRFRLVSYLNCSQSTRELIFLKFLIESDAIVENLIGVDFSYYITGFKLFLPIAYSLPKKIAVFSHSYYSFINVNPFLLP